MIHIYILRCPITKAIRYAGSSKNPKARYKQHIKDAKNMRTDKQRWITDLLQRGDAPIMELVGKAINEDQAVAFEEDLVIQNINTVYNIHMPGKNSGYVSHYRETGNREKKHGKPKKEP